MKKVLLVFTFFLSGCAISDFPFCCDQTGTSNVPYTTTYYYNSGVGFTNIGGDSSYLRIISQADIANLFNAANVSRVFPSGTITGTVLSLSGSLVDGVILEATDASGNKIGDLFYNGLGGIPDFSTSSGTSTNGGFTLLNAPPGEIYFKAVQGGRGNTSTISIHDAATLTNMSVIPVVPPFVGMTGTVTEVETEKQIANALVLPVGLKGLSVFSSSGRYRFPSLGSDSRFLIKLTASDFLPTYQEAVTDLHDLLARPQGAVDFTRNLLVFSNAFKTAVLNQTETGFQIDSTRGILAGTIQDPDGTPRQYPYITVTDDQAYPLNFDQASRSQLYYHGVYFNVTTGNSSPTYFFYPAKTLVKWTISPGLFGSFDCADPKSGVFVNGAQVKTCPPSEVGALDGKFIAFNLPPGPINLSVTALEKTTEGFDYFTGGARADIFPGSVTLKEITMNKMDLGRNNFYQSFSGHVTDSDGVTPISFVNLFALGAAGSSTAADLYGNFNVAIDSNLFLNKAAYTLKVSRSQYLDTYQDIMMDGTLKNLVAFSVAVLNQYLNAGGLMSQLDPAKGVLTGLIVDNATGRGTDGVTLGATDFNGNVVGDIRYFDSTGLPARTQSSSKNGSYIIFNLPPGFLQIRVVSADDSGNILAHSYQNGVTMQDLHVNNGPPPGVQVSGLTKDLNGALGDRVNLSVQGEKIRFTSSGGGFSHSFSPNSRYRVKARAPQPGGIDTYTLFDTLLTDIQSLTLWALTTSTIQSQVKNENFTPDFSQGILGGVVTSIGFSQPRSISGYQASAVTDPLTVNAQQKMVLGLFDEDNEVDLAVTNSADNTLTVLRGGGDGTFRKTSASPFCMPKGSSLLPGESCSSGARPVAVRSSDLNGDHIPDLIVANYGDDSVTVLFGAKGGNFIFGSSIALPPGSRPIALSVGDFNNDMIPDLVVLNSGNNTFSWIRGTGNGTFSNQIYSFPIGGTAPSSILSRDFNGDGNLDLAIVNKGSNTVSIFLGFGSGTFVPAPNSPLGTGSSPVGMVADDINGDGKIDLVVANQGSNSFSVFLGKGGGLFLPAAGSPFSLSGPPQFITINDLNFDGRPDVIASFSTGTVSVRTGLGDGTFASEMPYSVANNPTNLVAADFNDDTFTDLIAYQASSGTLSFLSGIEVPLSGVSLLASDLAGNPAGAVRYLDVNGNILYNRDMSGNIISPMGQTDLSGRFIVYNVPPGITNVHTTQSASGNRLMTSYSGSATFAQIPAVPPDVRQINYSGRTANAVGQSGVSVATGDANANCPNIRCSITSAGNNLVVRFVEGVQISLLGTGLTTFSDAVNSTFNFKVNANSALFIKLQR